MPKEFSRTDRMADVIQRELSMLIQREIKDPRLPAIVTISGVKVSRDFAYAKVYYTVIGEDEDRQAAKEVLTSSAGFLRSQLAKRIKARKIPQLTFIYDDSIDYGNRISSLINEALADDDNNEEEE